jgi:hypothetical protein
MKKNKLILKHSSEEEAPVTEVDKKISREMDWKDGFHVYQDGKKVQLGGMKKEALVGLINYYETENNVSILRKLLKTKTIPSPHVGNKNDESTDLEN